MFKRYKLWAIVFILVPSVLFAYRYEDYIASFKKAQPKELFDSSKYVKHLLRQPVADKYIGGYQVLEEFDTVNNWEMQVSELPADPDNPETGKLPDAEFMLHWKTIPINDPAYRETTPYFSEYIESKADFSIMGVKSYFPDGHFPRVFLKPKNPISVAKYAQNIMISLFGMNLDYDVFLDIEVLHKTYHLKLGDLKYKGWKTFSLDLEKSGILFPKDVVWGQEPIFNILALSFEANKKGTKGFFGTWIDKILYTYNQFKETDVRDRSAGYPLRDQFNWGDTTSSTGLNSTDVIGNAPAPPVNQTGN